MKVLPGKPIVFNVVVQQLVGFHDNAMRKGYCDILSSRLRCRHIRIISSGFVTWVLVFVLKGEGEAR